MGLQSGLTKGESCLDCQSTAPEAAFFSCKAEALLRTKLHDRFLTAATPFVKYTRAFVVSYQLVSLVIVLADQNTLAKLVSTVEAGPNSAFLEIGPGRGREYHFVLPVGPCGVADVLAVCGAFASLQKQNCCCLLCHCEATPRVLAGQGALTCHLLRCGATVLAVEKDRVLAQALSTLQVPKRLASVSLMPALQSAAGFAW